MPRQPREPNPRRGWAALPLRASSALCVAKVCRGLVLWKRAMGPCESLSAFFIVLDEVILNALDLCRHALSVCACAEGEGACRAEAGNILWHTKCRKSLTATTVETGEQGRCRGGSNHTTFPTERFYCANTHPLTLHCQIWSVSTSGQNVGPRGVGRKGFQQEASTTALWRVAVWM